MNRPVDLLLLRVFVAVVEEGSVTAGARRLYLTQPTVTRQLQALEKRYGTRLLQRSHGGVVPTPVGLVLEREARRLLRGSEEMDARLARAAAGEDELSVTREEDSWTPLELPP